MLVLITLVIALKLSANDFAKALARDWIAAMIDDVSIWGLVGLFVFVSVSFGNVPLFMASCIA